MRNLECDENDPEALFRLGATYQEQQDWGKAETVCKTLAALCLRLDDRPGAAQALAFIAHMRERQGDTSGARDYGVKALELTKALSPEEWRRAYSEPHPFLRRIAMDNRSPEKALQDSIRDTETWIARLDHPSRIIAPKDFWRVFAQFIFAASIAGLIAEATGIRHRLFEPLEDVKGLWWKTVSICFVVQVYCYSLLQYWRRQAPHPLNTFSVSLLQTGFIGSWLITLAILIWDTFFRR